METITGCGGGQVLNLGINLFACVLKNTADNSAHILDPSLSRAVEGYRPCETAATASSFILRDRARRNGANACLECLKSRSDNVRVVSLFAHCVHFLSTFAYREGFFVFGFCIKSFEVKEPLKRLSKCYGVGAIWLSQERRCRS